MYWHGTWYSKQIYGIIGGFLGGLFGGLAFEYIRIFSPDNLFARLIGLIILGFCIGVFYGFIENKLSKAALYLLNGRFKGKEFLLTRKLTCIGKSEDANIEINGYNKVEDIHARIKRNKKEFIIEDASSKDGTYVNDIKIQKTKLQHDDVVRMGDMQFHFQRK